MGTLLPSCVEVREPIELFFGVVRVVGPGIGVLDGGQHAASKMVVSGCGGFFPIRFNDVLLSRKVLDSCVKS